MYNKLRECLNNCNCFASLDVHCSSERSVSYKVRQICQLEISIIILDEATISAVCLNCNDKKNHKMSLNTLTH